MTVTDITCYNDMERILVESVPYLVVAK